MSSKEQTTQDIKWNQGKIGELQAQVNKLEDELGGADGRSKFNTFLHLVWICVTCYYFYKYQVMLNKL